MICPTCGTKNDIGVRFCRKCGTNLRNRQGYTEYGGFLRRFYAALIDESITTVPLFVFMYVVDVPTPVLWIVLVVVRWVYFAGMESSEKQATIGKRAAGIIVTDMHGERISFNTATVRHFSKIPSALSSIGYYMIAVSEKKQGLHDMIAGCLVVVKDYCPDEYHGYRTHSWHDIYKESKSTDQVQDRYRLWL